MKIINFNSFLEFADNMITQYKFYRLLGNKIQCFMFGRDGIFIHSETESNQDTIMQIVEKGFKETILNKEEIELMRLE